MKTLRISLLLVSLILAFGGRAASLDEQIQQTVELPKQRITLPFSIKADISSSMEDVGAPGKLEIARRTVQAQEFAKDEKKRESDPQFYLELGRKWKSARIDDKAAAAFQKAYDLLLSANDGKGKTGRRRMLLEAAFETSRKEQAEALALECLAKEPKDAQAWFYLGQLRSQKAVELLMEAEGAVAAEKVIIKLWQLPEDSQTVFELVRQLMDGAMDAYAHCIQLAPKMPGAYAAKGYAHVIYEAAKHRAEKRPETFNFFQVLVSSQKMETLDALVAASSDDVRLLSMVMGFGIAQFVNSEGDPQEQRKAIKAYLENHQSIVSKLEGYLPSKDTEEALMAAEILAVSHMAADLQAKSADYFERVVRLAPDNKDYWRCYLYALEDSGQLGRLIRVVKEAKPLRTDTWTRLEMARVYALKGDRDNSKKQLDAAAEGDPADKVVMVAIAGWWLKFKDSPTDLTKTSSLLFVLSNDETLDANTKADVAYYRAVYFTLKNVFSVAEAQVDTADTFRPGDQRQAALRGFIKRKRAESQ